MKYWQEAGETRRVGWFARSGDKPVPRRRLNQPPSEGPSNAPAQPQADAALFRRNRTFTGSTSAEFGSATETSGTMQSPRAATHHLRRHQRRLGLLLLSLAVLSIGTWLLLAQVTASVRVTVYGQIGAMSDANQQRFVTKVEEYFVGRPFERLRFALDDARLAAYLQTRDLREVERITAVRSDGLGQTNIEIKVREPIASWAIGGDRRYVDKNGVIFSDNFFDAPSVAIRDESGLNTATEDAAQAVTSSRFLQFIGQTVGLLHAQGVQVRTVSIPPQTSRQVDMIVGSATRIRMTVDRPAGEQAEDGVRAYNFLTDKRRTARYVDVRVSGKAFYR